MKHKKLLALLLTAVMSVTAFAGCSSSSDSGESAEADSEEVTTEEESAEGTVEETVVTIFHHMGEEPKINALQALADNFSANNPGVTFDIQSIDYGQYAQILKTKINAGESPDIIFRRPKALPELIEEGMILDITDQAYIDNMQDAALPCLTIDDKVYGIVMDVTAIGVLYNKDVFDELGLEVPTTLDEYNQVIATLEENEVLPFARGYGDGWTAQLEYQSDQFYVLDEDPNFFGAIESGEKSFSDYPQVAESLERWKERLNHGNEDIFGTTDQRAYEMVATGEAAMINQGYWGMGTLQSLAPDANFGFFAPPIDNETPPTAHVFGDDGFMIAKDSPNVEIANQFFEYMLSPEGSKIWAETSGQISFAKDSGVEITDPAALQLLSYIESGNSFGQEDNATFSGAFDSLYKEYQELFPAVKDEMSVEEFIQELDAEFDALRQ